MTTELMGYAHPNYALSLQEFGEPRELPRCGGWILVRPIPGTPYKDAMGCYPLFACRDWTKLHEDLEYVGSDLVSLVLVTDTFSGITPASLEQCFDLVRPFKTHYIIDLSHPLESFVDKKHRYYARKSLKQLEVEVSLAPVYYLDEWLKLYKNLIRRHNISGISAFSSKSFEIQLQIPGMIIATGRFEDQVIGANLIIIKDGVAYWHLAAFSPDGYKIGASYGIFWNSLEYLRDNGVRFYDIGGGAGTTDDAEDGLAKFKADWSNDERRVYLCCRIFDRKKYESICQQKQIKDVNYFPAYRAGEINS